MGPKGRLHPDGNPQQWSSSKNEDLAFWAEKETRFLHEIDMELQNYAFMMRREDESREVKNLVTNTVQEFDTTAHQGGGDTGKHLRAVQLCGLDQPHWSWSLGCV